MAEKNILQLNTELAYIKREIKNLNKKIKKIEHRIRKIKIAEYDKNQLKLGNAE